MTGNSAATMGLQRAERKVILACAGWALLSGVLFVVAAVMGDRTGQFAVAVSLLKVGSFLMATVLCWRNAMTPEILSGRSVWQAIAVGMAFYALGDITVILWRSLWDITTTVSLSSVFYAASYLFLAIGLLLAVVPRQITLNWVQTLSIAVTGVLGIVLASWIAFQVPAVEPSTDAEMVGSEVAGVAAVILHSGSDERGTVGGLGAIASLPDEKREEKGAVESRKAPKIIQTIEQRLNPITRHFGLLYVAGDCVLVVLAVALLVAFWGGDVFRGLEAGGAGWAMPVCGRYVLDLRSRQRNLPSGRVLGDFLDFISVIFRAECRGRVRYFAADEVSDCKP